MPNRFSKEVIERLVQLEASQSDRDKLKKIAEWETTHRMIESALMEVADGMEWNRERTISMGHCYYPYGEEGEKIEGLHYLTLQFSSGEQPNVSDDYKFFYYLGVSWTPLYAWVSLKEHRKDNKNPDMPFFSVKSPDGKNDKEEDLYRLLGDAAKAYTKRKADQRESGINR